MIRKHFTSYEWRQWKQHQIRHAAYFSAGRSPSKGSVQFFYQIFSVDIWSFASLNDLIWSLLGWSQVVWEAKLQQIMCSSAFGENNRQTRWLSITRHVDGLDIEIGTFRVVWRNGSYYVVMLSGTDESSVIIIGYFGALHRCY